MGEDKAKGLVMLDKIYVFMLALCSVVFVVAAFAHLFMYSITLANAVFCVGSVALFIAVGKDIYRWRCAQKEARKERKL